jgi:glutamate-1-semialdehyde 2,1-aminomutase
MFQYYLRLEGLALSWVGTGRLIFSLNFPEADFLTVVDRLVAAANGMMRDGWWGHTPGQTNKEIKRTVLRELMAQRFGHQTQRAT